MGATHNYKNSRAAKLAIYELGEDIRAGKLPAHFGPLSFVFTGSGNVSQVVYRFSFIVLNLFFNHFQLCLIKIDYFIESAPYGFLFRNRKTLEAHE